MGIRKAVEQLLDKLGYRQGTLARKVVNSGAWVAVSSVGLNVLTIVRTIVLARLLTPEVFGVMSICLVVIGGFEVMTRTGFRAALIQRKHGFEAAKNVAFTLLVVRGVLLAALVFLVAPFVAEYYNEPTLDLIIRILAVSFVFQAFQNINIVAQEKNLEFRKIVYIEQLGSVLNTIVVVVVAYYFRSIWALVVGHIANSVLPMVLSYILIPGRPRVKFNRKIAWELFHFGKFITGAAIMLLIATEIDKLVIGKVIGMEALGYYYIAFMLANIPATHLAKLISRVMFPVYSSLQSDAAALEEAYLRVMGLVAGITIPAAIGLFVLAPDIVFVFYGEKWMAATEPLRILCVYGGFRALTSLNGFFLNGIGKPNMSFYILTFRVILLAILIYPFTLKYGLVGAAVSLTIPLIVQLIIVTWVVSKTIGLELKKLRNILSGTCFRGLVMGGVLVLVKTYVDRIDGIELVLMVLFGGGLYLAMSRKQIISIVKGDGFLRAGLRRGHR